jgi:GTPase
MLNSYRADVATAEAGQCVALALKRVRRVAVRKGMVIAHKTDTPPKGEYPIRY